MSENANAQVLTAIAALGARFDNLDAKVDKLQGDVTRFRTDIMARVDRLQGRVDQIHDDLVVAQGNVDRAIQTAQRARSDIEALSEMQSTIIKMQRRSATRLDKLEDRDAGGDDPTE